MKVFIYNCPKIIEGLRDKALSFKLRMYFSDFAIEKGIMYILAPEEPEEHNPLIDIWRDFSFNEPDEYRMFHEKYGDVTYSMVKRDISWLLHKDD